MTPQQTKAYSRATARCSRAECCRHDLLQSFLRGGLSHAEADEVLDRLEDENYLNADRYARAFAHDKLRYDGWGRQKIRQGLLLKRLPETSVREALDAIDEDEYRKQLTQLLRKKSASTTAATFYEQHRKVARYAISRGFEPHLVFEMLGMQDEDEN